MPEAAPPAGWYPDARSDRNWRWWDGAAWTSHTAPRWSPLSVDRSRIRPRAWAFGLAAIPAALGLAAAVVLVVSAIDAGSRTIDRLNAPLTPFQAPGSVAIALRAGETRTVYAPAASAGTAAGADLRCRVFAPDGSSAGATAAGNVTLRQDGQRYRALLDFTAPPGGADRVSCRRGVVPGPAVPLAIGPRFKLSEFLAIFARAFGAFGALIVGIGLGTGIGVLVGVRRERAEKRLQAEAATVPPPREPPGGEGG